MKLNLGGFYIMTVTFGVCMAATLYFIQHSGLERVFFYSKCFTLSFYIMLRQFVWWFTRFCHAIFFGRQKLDYVNKKHFFHVCLHQQMHVTNLSFEPGAYSSPFLHLCTAVWAWSWPSWACCAGTHSEINTFCVCAVQKSMALLLCFIPGCPRMTPYVPKIASKLTSLYLSRCFHKFSYHLAAAF